MVPVETGYLNSYALVYLTLECLPIPPKCGRIAKRTIGRQVAEDYYILLRLLEETNDLLQVAGERPYVASRQLAADSVERLGMGLSLLGLFS
jgi:hypothetical protein